MQGWSLAQLPWGSFAFPTPCDSLGFKAKCWCCTWVRESPPQCQSGLGMKDGEQPWEERLGVLVGERLNPPWLCALAPKSPPLSWAHPHSVGSRPWGDSAPLLLSGDTPCPAASSSGMLQRLCLLFQTKPASKTLISKPRGLPEWLLPVPKVVPWGQGERRGFRGRV